MTGAADELGGADPESLDWFNPNAQAVGVQSGIPAETVPVTIDTVVDGLTVTATWSGTGVEAGCELFWGDEDITGAGPEYPGPGGTGPGGTGTHTYPEAGTYTMSVDPLGDEYVKVTADVTVSRLNDDVYDPSAHTVADVVAYVEDHPDERDAVIAAERAGKNRTTLLEALGA